MRERRQEFLFLLLTNAAALLLALLLNSAVEMAHHRHQRREAEALIQVELRQNRTSLARAQDDMQGEVSNLVRVLDFLEARSQGKPGDAKDLTLGFREGPLQDSAWRTAGSTGVLAFMDYGQVQKYALAYKEQEQFEAMEQTTLNEYLQLDAYVVKGFHPEALDADDVKSAIPGVRSAIAHVMGMLDISRGALMAYDDALK